MKVQILSESGHREALFGMRLSHGVTSGVDFATWEPTEKDYGLADKLASKDGGHNKFLESVSVWIDITAPRYWHSQFDTYRIGVTKQSESTMHTMHRRQLTREDFEKGYVEEHALAKINMLVSAISNNPHGEFLTSIKRILPEGFLQRRIVCTNYKTLRNIYHQRRNHKLSEWKLFCSELENQLKCPLWIALPAASK